MIKLQNVSEITKPLRSYIKKVIISYFDHLEQNTDWKLNSPVTVDFDTYVQHKYKPEDPNVSHRLFIYVKIRFDVSYREQIQISDITIMQYHHPHFRLPFVSDKPADYQPYFRLSFPFVPDKPVDHHMQLESQTNVVEYVMSRLLEYFFKEYARLEEEQGITPQSTLNIIKTLAFTYDHLAQYGITKAMNVRIHYWNQIMDQLFNAAVHTDQFPNFVRAMYSLDCYLPVEKRLKSSISSYMAQFTVGKPVENGYHVVCLLKVLSEHCPKLSIHIDEDNGLYAAKIYQRHFYFQRKNGVLYRVNSNVKAVQNLI